MRPLRLRLLAATALLLALPLPPASAGGEEGWTDVLVDATGDVDALGLGFPFSTDPRSDLHVVSVREDGALFRIRLRSAGEDAGPLPQEPVPSARHESFLSFYVEQRHGPSLLVEMRADADGFGLFVEGRDENESLLVEEGSTPTHWEVALPRWSLLRTGQDPTTRLVNAAALVLTRHADGRTSTDTADQATPFPFTPLPRFRLERTWAQATGAPFAAGPSVAAAPDGTLHLAFVTTAGERGAEPGVYHGLLRHGRLWKERLDNVSVAVPGRAVSGMQTALALDARGAAHVLYEPGPGRGVRYASDATGNWVLEDPAKVADGAPLAVDDGVRAGPALAVGGGRVVAALQRADLDEVVLVERDANGAWRTLRALEPARQARLALDPEGRLHVAWLRPGASQGPGRADYAELVHASEKGGWKETVLARDVEERTGFWQDGAADGSFAFTLDPKGVPHFAYETDRRERAYVILGDDGPERHPTPLRADHGNIQSRMRMAIDAQGRAHLVTGYGGSDLYAVRSPSGAWHVEPLSRYDSFSLALTPDGRAALAHVQPHGGATLGLAYQPGPETESPFDAFDLSGLSGMDTETDPPRDMPGAGIVGALLALVVGAACSRRRRG